MIGGEGLDTIQIMTKQAIVTPFEGVTYRQRTIITRLFLVGLLGLSYCLVSFFGLSFRLTSLLRLGLSRRCGRCFYPLLLLGQNVTTQANPNLTPLVVGR